MRTLFLSVPLSTCWFLSSCMTLKSTEFSPWKDGIENADRNHIYYPNTRRPFDWDWFTKRKVWTERPTTYNHHEENNFGNTSIILIVVVPSIGLLILGVIIKFMCTHCNDSDSESVIIHQPPSRFIAPPRRTLQTSQNSYAPVGASRPNYLVQGFSHDFPPRNNDGVSSISNAVDKPPEYFDVVRTENIAKFPQTSGKQNEIPPPKYEEDTLRY